MLCTLVWTPVSGARAANPREERGSGEVLRGASKGLWKVGVAGGPWAPLQRRPEEKVVRRGLLTP